MVVAAGDGGGRALHAACRFRPGSSCQGSAAAAAAGRWERGGRGWLHRGSHSASSSRRRRHCVLSAPVARCGASGGGRSRGRGQRTGARPLPRRRQGSLAWEHLLCPGLARTPGRCGLKSRVHPRAAPSAQGRAAPEAPAAASAEEPSPGAQGRAFKCAPAERFAFQMVLGPRCAGCAGDPQRRPAKRHGRGGRGGGGALRGRCFLFLPKTPGPFNKSINSQKPLHA